MLLQLLMVAAVKVGAAMKWEPSVSSEASAVLQVLRSFYEKRRRDLGSTGKQNLTPAVASGGGPGQGALTQQSRFQVNQRNTLQEELRSWWFRPITTF